MAYLKDLVCKYSIPLKVRSTKKGILPFTVESYCDQNLYVWCRYPDGRRVKILLDCPTIDDYEIDE